jgi:hypothetical protein
MAAKALNAAKPPPVTTTFATNRLQLCRPLPSSHGPPEIATPDTENTNQPGLPQPALSVTATVANAIMVGTRKAITRKGSMRTRGFHRIACRAAGLKRAKASVSAAGTAIAPNR